MKKGFLPVLLILLIISYYPTLALFTGYTGVTLFFPSYFIASTVYLLLVLLVLKKIKINLPLPILLLIIIIKSVLVQLVLLYFFTPFFDFVALMLSINKLCSQETISFLSENSKSDQIIKACDNLRQVLGR